MVRDLDRGANRVKERVQPDGWPTYPGVAHAVRVGDQLHISGQVAIDADGNVVGRDDALRQAEQCFQNIEILLDAAGMTKDDLVKLTCFLVDRAHYGAYAEAKAAFLGDPPVPVAGTAVIVAGLVSPALLMEVEAVAEMDGPEMEGKAHP